MTAPRIAMELALVAQSPRGPWSVRTIRDSDAQGLAILLYAAFRGTVDDEGETFSDAMTEIENVFAGRYGRLLPDCSFVIEQGEFLTSACLISWFELHDAPLVVFTMTRPESQRRGMARFLLRQSIDALLAAGHDRLTLVVTDTNLPAVALYRALGFLPMPDLS